MSLKNDFMDFLFTALNRDFRYLVLRNYEGLPYDEGHDIDLLISDAEKNKIAPLLQQLKTKFQVTVFHNYRYPGLFSNVIVFDDNIIHLDFFTNIRWKSVPLISTEAMLATRMLFNGIYVIDDYHYQLYCWFQSIILNGRLKSKYQEKAMAFEPGKPSEYKGIVLNHPSAKRRLASWLFRHYPWQSVIGIGRKIFLELHKHCRPYGFFYYESDAEQFQAQRDLMASRLVIGTKSINIDGRGIKKWGQLLRYLAHEQCIEIVGKKGLKPPWLLRLLSARQVVFHESLKETVRSVYGKMEG